MCIRDRCGSPRPGCWSTAVTGVSATGLRREMELGSVQTAWAMLHRYRSVMAGPGRDRLRGDVEVDQSFLGGPESGGAGRGGLGKVLFAGAVEVEERGVVRAPLCVISDATLLDLDSTREQHPVSY